MCSFWEYPEDDGSQDNDGSEGDVESTDEGGAPGVGGENRVDTAKEGEDESDAGEEDEDMEVVDPDDDSTEGYRLRGKMKGKESKSSVKTTGAVTTATHTQKIHCAKKLFYWCGTIKLIKGYWSFVRVSVWIIWAGKWQYAVW